MRCLIAKQFTYSFLDIWYFSIGWWCAAPDGARRTFIKERQTVKRFATISNLEFFLYNLCRKLKHLGPVIYYYWISSQRLMGNCCWLIAKDSLLGWIFHNPFFKHLYDHCIFSINSEPMLWQKLCLFAVCWFYNQFKEWWKGSCCSWYWIFYSAGGC